MAEKKHPLISKLEACGITAHNVAYTQKTLSFSLDVMAKPGSKKQGIILVPGGVLKVAVAARPVEGAANEAIIKFLSEKLGISASSLSLVAGGKSKLKRIVVTYLFTDNKNIDYYLSKLEKLLDI